MSERRATLNELRAAIARHHTAPPSRSGGQVETGLVAFDEPLGGGLPKSGLIELVCPANHPGATTLLVALLRQRARRQQWTALIDSADQFDPQTAGAEALSRMLWLRCSNAREAFRSADLLLRDANLPLVIFDLRGANPTELRRVPPNTWYRFQRLIEPAPVTLLTLTSRGQVPCAQVRLELATGFDLDALDREQQTNVTACHLRVKSRGEVPAEASEAG